jgi:hypothetical protein
MQKKSLFSKIIWSLVVTVSFCVSAQAEITVPSGNLTTNPSFESSTSGWIGWHANISQAPSTDAPNGSYVARVESTTGTSYSIDDWPNTVSTSYKNQVYRAIAYVKAGSPSSVGKPIQLVIRESDSSGNVVKQTKSISFALSNEYQRLTVSALAQGDRNIIDVYLIQSQAEAGNSFYVDLVSLEAPAGNATGSFGSRFGMAVGCFGSDYDSCTEGVRATGSRWVRLDVEWASVQWAGPSTYYWTPYDNAIGAALSRGMRVLGILDYTPAWARSAGTTKMYPPTNVSDYVNFVRQAVRRYAPLGVHHWEIWNEPNSATFWKPAPDAAAYANLLKAAYQAIKEEDPYATVISAGLAPATDDGLNIAPVTFLTRVYAAGAGGSMDAVGFHPYSFPAMPSDAYKWNAWQQMENTSPSLRSVMIQNGDGNKKIWMTEYGAPTNGPQGSTAVTEQQQADMLNEAYRLAMTFDWAGPMMWYSFRDKGTDTSTMENFFGLLRSDLSQKPAYSVYLNFPK